MRIINTADYPSEESLGKLSPNDREAMYNGLDCCVTLEILHVLLAELDDTSRATYQRSLDLRGPILEMSMRGIRIDLARRDRVLLEKQTLHAHVLANFNRICIDGIGEAFNYSSTHALKHLFYTTLGLKPIKKRNANGLYVPTVNREALEALQLHFWATPLCLHIITLRELDKQIQFLKTGLDADGRIRSTFNIAGTNTGRLASSMSEFGTGTNLQNVDRLLRTIFIPDPGMKFINIDLEQGDSRNMGAMMWDIFLESHGAEFAGSYLDACESSDLHTRVSQMTWPHLGWTDDAKANRKIADILFYRQDSYRQTSKKLGHGTNYMGQPPTMAKNTKMPVRVIEEFQSGYFSAFPCIPAYHAWIKQQIKDYGSLTTLHSRRRFFFGRHDDKKVINEAVAYPSQSMTADAVNKAMISIWRADIPAQLLCQVHDSLLFQVPAEQCDDLVPKILAIGREAATLHLRGGRSFFVPNEAKVGWNWGDFDKSNPDENPNGLITWKGSDPRAEPAPKTFSLRRLLG